MSDTQQRPPGFWRFQWMYFMQPEALNTKDIHIKRRWWRLWQREHFLIPAAGFTLAVSLSLTSPSLTVYYVVSMFVFVFYLAIGMLFSSSQILRGNFRVPKILILPIFWAVIVTQNALTPNDDLSPALWGFLLGVSRAPFNLLEMAIQTAARAASPYSSRGTLRWAPVRFHEMSFFPHPLLESHLLLESDAHPKLTREVLDACELSIGQRRIGQRVEARLRAKELHKLTQSQDFEAITELRGTWLPGIQGADPVLLAFAEAARFAAAAQTAFNPSHALEHLKRLGAQLNAIENQRPPYFDAPLQAFKAHHQESTAKAKIAAAGQIPNPFRAGNPLSTDDGPEVFRGRESAAREIEDILADTARPASLQLLAPRRSGKTSLLKMLPTMLPDTLCVFFDLQAHPVASVASFWQKLAEQAILQAKRDRRTEIPPFPKGPPMEAAEKWLAQLDQLNQPVLLAIDESERLEDLFPGSRTEFLQLMGLFRATIQHRRGVRILVSGAAEFSDLDRVWDDHFISARQVRLPYLDRQTTITLLNQPTAEFPKEAIPEAVAAAVFQNTGGQPFLVQVYGSLLVRRLNENRSKIATVQDVDAVKEGVIEWAEPYFRDMYNNAPAPASQALDQLAQGQSPELAPATRRWLNQRYLLTNHDRLAIPIFGAWLKFHALV